MQQQKLVLNTKTAVPEVIMGNSLTNISVFTHPAGTAARFWPPPAPEGTCMNKLLQNSQNASLYFRVLDVNN